MALRADNATQFGDKKGFGIDDTTGNFQPVADLGGSLGEPGASTAAKRFAEMLAKLFTSQSDGGAKLQIKIAEEDITLATGATTTDSTANLLPANSVILAVMGQVLTTITSSATGWSLCDATTAARFTANNTTLTAGTFDVGFLQWGGAVSTDAAGPTQASAAKLRITCAGGNPGAGKIRATVFYLAGSKAA
jgi:hypothetical protein